MNKPDAYTIIANPGENAANEVNINWHTDIGSEDTAIFYTIATDSNWYAIKKQQAEISVCNIFNNKFSKNELGEDIYEEIVFLNCSVVLKDLQADTKYMYRVGLSNLSEIHYFKTAGNDFNFIWISDFHHYLPLPKRKENAMNVMDMALAQNEAVDFIFCTGDTVAWGGSYSFWKSLYEDKYFRNYSWMNILGNHDYMSRNNISNCDEYFKMVNNFPKNGYAGQLGVCYYVKYGNSLFIILNNEDLGVSDIFNEKIEIAQKWVEKVINDNPSKYIFVCQHYQWINGSNGKTRTFGYERWYKLFDKYNVDFALAANDHIYLRTHPLYSDKVVLDESLGTIYIQAPSADGERGAEVFPFEYNEEKIAYRFCEGKATIGALAVSVNDECVTFKLINQFGEIIDTVKRNAKARRL